MGTYAGELHRIAYRFSGAATWSLMLIALYAMFEARRRATGELHGVRVAALAAERALLEGDLRAMRARVDPDLLVDSLLAVDRAYPTSTRSGAAAPACASASWLSAGNADVWRSAQPRTRGGQSGSSRSRQIMEEGRRIAGPRP